MEAKGWARTKSLDVILQDAAKPEYQLRRALGPWHLTLLGIGAIIGAGIFATIGTAAAGDAHRPGAGPALMLSFVITALVCAFTALCYAEFAAMVPISGSAYTYSYATLGELIAWIIGWDLIIEYAVGNIAVAISWANYFKTFLEGFLEPLGREVPFWIAMDYRTAAAKGLLGQAPQLFGQPIVVNLLAAGIVGVITVILVWGIRESARFNAIMVGVKIVVLTFFIVVGLAWVQPANWQPFAPNGWAGLSAGAAIIFFAYIGFDAVSTVAEETKNPQRNLPIGIIASLIICTVFYVVVAAVFTGLISMPALQGKMASEQAEPLTMALDHAITDAPLRDWAVGIVAFGSVIAHTAVLLVFQLGQPRIFYAMSRDGLLPPAFRKVHPRYRTPHVATILTGVFVAFFAAFASLDEMVDLTNIGTLFAFILVCAGILVLRVREPDRPRPFRAPGGLVMPVLGIVSCLYLIYYLPPTSWLRFAAWLNFGFVIYIAYGAVNSRLTGRHLSTTPAVHDVRTAYLGTWLAVIGIGLLLFTRGLDLYLESWKMPASIRADAMSTHSGRMTQLPALDPSGFLQFSSGISASCESAAEMVSRRKNMTVLELAGTALGEASQPDAWIERSWFLLLPLALNAAVLFPIIVRRALPARALGGELRARADVTIAIAVILAAGSAAYVTLMLTG